jgi:hypothetical protein
MWGGASAGGEAMFSVPAAYGRVRPHTVEMRLLNVRHVLGLNDKSNHKGVVRRVPNRMRSAWRKHSCPLGRRDLGGDMDD